MKPVDARELRDNDMDLLLPLVDASRVERMKAILDMRTRAVTMVLEDFWDPHNMWAVIRSCDAFGVQDAHVVLGPQGKGRAKPSRRVTRGTQRWLTLRTWDNTSQAIEAVRAKGYRIAVAHVGAKKKLSDMDFTTPISIWLGNEHIGPSEALLEAADETFEIPMIGFVESFNVSVAAAICLQASLAQRMKAMDGDVGDLSDAEKTTLLRKWVFQDIRRGPEVLRELRRRNTGESDGE